MNNIEDYGLRQKIDEKNISLIRDGFYVGANCSIIMDRGWISIVVSDDQLEMLKKYKNYEFHFDEHGDFSGTGTVVDAHYKNQIEMLSKLEKTEEDLIEKKVVRNFVDEDGYLDEALR